MNPDLEQDEPVVEREKRNGVKRDEPEVDYATDREVEMPWDRDVPRKRTYRDEEEVPNYGYGYRW